MKPNEDTRVDKDVRWAKHKKLADILYVKNTDDLLEVPPRAKEVMQELHNQEYSLNIDLIDFVIANKEAIGKKLGWKTREEVEELYFNRQSGAESANQSIVEQLGDLINARNEYERRTHLVGDGAINKGEGGIYFDWFMSRNGRFFIDSTGLNPQTNKFQRFL